MKTFSALLAICAGNSPVTGEFPSQRPVTQSFDVFFDLRQNKQLSKQSWCWWFETQLRRQLWRHCNVKTGRPVAKSKDSRIQGFYWPLIGHRPVQAYFTYDTISPTWRTHDTGCFTFCSITVYMDNICKPIHSFHHNRHYTDPKYSEGFSGVFNHQMAQGRLIIRGSFVKLKLCI